MALDGMVDIDQRLRWLMMTWDLACPTPGNGRYIRFYVSLDSFVVTSGARSANAFTDEYTDTKPLTGRRRASGHRTPTGLEEALQLTEKKIEEGFVMLCRPLAVDLQKFDGAPLVTGFILVVARALSRTEASDAADVLAELEIGSFTGREALAEINRVRAGAAPSRMEPEAVTVFAGKDAADLWAGR